jgi:hypothetical protein
MDMIFFPDQKRVVDFLQVDDPVLIRIKHDQSEAIRANIDDRGEHYIPLPKVGCSVGLLYSQFAPLQNRYIT